VSAVKKHKREGSAFLGFRKVVEEEFGDAIWYLTALCRRTQINIEEIFAGVAKNGKYSAAIAASDVPGWPLSEVVSVTNMPKLDDVLLGLGRSTAALLTVVSGSKDVRAKIADFADCFMHALQASGVSFADVIAANLSKTRG